MHIDYPQLEGKDPREQLAELQRWAVEVTEKINYMMDLEEERQNGL